MALFNSIALGSARQKIGNVVLYRSKGQSIARQLNPAPLNPQTTGQVAQRSALANAVKAWKATFGFFSVLFSMITSRLSAYNTFVSAVIPVAKIAGPSVWDYQDAILALATKNDADGDFIGSNQNVLISSITQATDDEGIKVKFSPLIFPLPDSQLKVRCICYDDEGSFLEVAPEVVGDYSDAYSGIEVPLNQGDMIGNDYIVAVAIYDETLGQSSALHFEKLSF